MPLALRKPLLAPHDEQRGLKKPNKRVINGHPYIVFETQLVNAIGGNYLGLWSLLLARQGARWWPPYRRGKLSSFPNTVDLSVAKKDQMDRVETADDDERNFIIFSDSKSALQAISGQDWTHSLVLYILERLHWLVQYQEK